MPTGLISRLRLYLGGEATVHMVNRLDRETSGVVVASIDGCRRLAKALGDAPSTKQYLAIAHGWPREEHVVISSHWREMRPAVFPSGLCPLQWRPPDRVLWKKFPARRTEIQFAEGCSLNRSAQIPHPFGTLRTPDRGG
jgi:hypothetical protein